MDRPVTTTNVTNKSNNGSHTYITSANTPVSRGSTVAFYSRFIGILELHSHLREYFMFGGYPEFRAPKTT